MVSPNETGMYGLGMSFNSPGFMNWRNSASEDETAFKALTTDLSTNSGVVTPGTTGGAALRVQYLHDVLETVSYEESDAVLMKRIPKEKVYSQTFEWSTFDAYGTEGSAFVSETGNTSTFGDVGAVDDNFTRQVAQIKYLAVVREISLAATAVRSIEEARKVAEIGATRELVGKANLAGYYGSSLKVGYEWNGLEQQIISGVDAKPADSDILYDCGGQPLDENILEEISLVNRQKFGNAHLLLTSPQTYGDAQKLLFPKERFVGGGGNEFGIDKRNFTTPYGKIEFLDDPMLRKNKPGVVDGTGVDGKPRTATTATIVAGNTWAASPFYALASGAGIGLVTVAASGNFWQNGSKNTDASTDALVAAKVPFPSGAGNQANRLDTSGAAHYYAASIVYQGKEGLPMAYNSAGGSAVAGTIGTPVGFTPSSTQIVQVMIVNASGACLPTASINRSQQKIRIYKCVSTSVPTNFNQFDLVAEIGVPIAQGTTNSKLVEAVYFDNGYQLAGTDTAFFITEKRNGAKGWMFAQLMPMFRRDLPHSVMGERFAMVSMATPILLVPRHHMILRNIGRVR